MRIKYKAVMFAFLTAFCLSSCDKKQDVWEEQPGQEERVHDFISYGGPNMTVTPEGYYAMQKGFLYFITPDFSESTIVCDDLECIHNDKNVENLTNYFECDAYFGTLEPQIDYYDGSLYIVGENPNGESKNAVYKVSLDGTDKELIYECRGQEVNGFTIYEGTAYVGQTMYTASAASQCVTAVPLKHPDQAEVLYETEEYESRTMNQMKCYDGYCYFYLFDPSIWEEDSVYIRINLETGEPEEMYKPSPCRIEMGKDRYMLYVQDYIKNGDSVTWDNAYYFMDPESMELTSLDEEDFESIGRGDLLRNMDDEYIYFISTNYGEEPVPQEEQKIYVYEYDGTLAAQISAADFGTQYNVLPGTEDYMFIQVRSTDWEEPLHFYYVDKSEFNGGEVRAHLIKIGE